MHTVSNPVGLRRIEADYFQSGVFRISQDNESPLQERNPSSIDPRER